MKEFPTSHARSGALGCTGLFDHEPGAMLFEEGETIPEEGRRSRSLYVVLDGSAEIRSEGRLVGTVESGGVFGEMSLVDDAPVSADVVATSISVIVPVSEERFLRLVQTHPSFALDLMRVMSERIRRMNTHTSLGF